MAAGIVLRNITTADGVTLAVPMWADDTVTPTQFTPISIAVTSAGVPISALTDAELRATAVPVSGTVSVSGGATSANQGTAITKLGDIETAITAGQLEATAFGTPATNALGVQGKSNMVPLRVDPIGFEYEAVAASQTTQALGATGATGDLLAHLLVIPATLSPGGVAIKDGAGTAITVFTGGTDSVGSLVPFAIPIYGISTAGAWQVTTGANVSAIAFGFFT